MKTAELRNMTNEELQQQGLQLSEELFNLRMRKVVGQLENPLKMRTIKRDIARVKTVLQEKRVKPASS